MAKPSNPTDERIPLSHAAAALHRSRSTIERLVRTLRVVKPGGTRGKGGRLHLDIDDLVVLRAAARLEDLHVPGSAFAPALRSVRRQLSNDLRLRVTLAYCGNDRLELLESAHGVSALLSNGVSAQTVDAQKDRQMLRERLAATPAPPARGRPAFDSAWVRQQLDGSKDLTIDDPTPEEIRRLLPDQGKTPWSRAKRSRRS